MARRVVLVLGLTALTFAAPPAAAQRQRLSMDPGWRFTLGDPQGAQQAAFDDRAWRRLDLPHHLSIQGTASPDAPAARAARADLPPRPALGPPPPLPPAPAP